jgi:ABC-type transport system substrate-binding protein
MPKTSALATALLAAALATTAVAGCSGSNAPGKAVLKLGLQDPPSTLDPAVAYNIPAIGVSHLMFNGLVTFDPQAKVVPDLAETWTLSPDGREYRFALRDGVRFHDGKPLTSADVKYSLERVLKPATKSPGASFFRQIEGAPAVIAGSAAHAGGILTPSPREVVIRLTAPRPYFLQLLAMGFGAVVPEGQADAPGFEKHPIGTGPFVFEQMVTGQRITLRKNPHYFKPEEPKLDGIEIHLGLNEQVETLRFERGELDVLGVFRNIGAADYVRLAKDPKWKGQFLEAPDNAVHYLGLNTGMKPFDNPKVREAVARAIDKTKIVTLLNGRAVPAEGMLPPSLPGFDPADKGYPYSPDVSRKLLAEAGYPNGFTTPYWTSNSQTVLKVAQQIQQDLSQVGIKAELKPVTFPTLLSAVSRPGNTPMFGGNWSQDYPDPSNFLPTLFHSRQISPTHAINSTFFQDAMTDQLLDRADGLPSEAERFATYREAQARIIAQSPVVPLYHPKNVDLTQPWVKGYRLHPVWPIDPTGLTLSK